jgi:adenine-specific DNA-methyltransferase
VPFDTDPDWPAELQAAVTHYRQAWRAKMDEVNKVIADNAESEELVDQPQIDRSKVRVSGPFTVEAVQPPEFSLGDPGEAFQFGGAPDELATFEPREVVRPASAVESERAYLSRMIENLRLDGVTFPNNSRLTFSVLGEAAGGFHAEGRWVAAGQTDLDPGGPPTVGVFFGPQYGPVTVKKVEELIKPASRKYDHLLVAGFAFDAESQALAQDLNHPRLKIHITHVRPDANPQMDTLLKAQPNSQLFTVFGLPDTEVRPDKDGAVRVVLNGVDIYDPVAGEVRGSKADKVAAWFLDGDYDGRTFCVAQAFFPDRDAWAKLANALGDKGAADPEAFAAFKGTVSLPFRPGKHKKAAVKVIDPRGNEVMRVHDLG